MFVCVCVHVRAGTTEIIIGNSTRWESEALVILGHTVPAGGQLWLFVAVSPWIAATFEKNYAQNVSTNTKFEISVNGKYDFQVMLDYLKR